MEIKVFGRALVIINMTTRCHLGHAQTNYGIGFLTGQPL